MGWERNRKVGNYLKIEKVVYLDFHVLFFENNYKCSTVEKRMCMYVFSMLNGHENFFPPFGFT